MQAGLLSRGTGEWVVDCDKPSFLWKTWPSHEEFVTWQGADDLPRLFGGLNFFEPVPAVSRLVFQVTDLGALKCDGTPVHALKDSFFRALVGDVLPRVQRALVGVGALDAVDTSLDCWRFTDASAVNGPHSFRAYSQTITLTERSKQALLAALPAVGLVGDECDFVFDLSSFAFTGRPVLMVKCIDGRYRLTGNNPISQHMAGRMVVGERLVYSDFAASSGFYADGLHQPLCLQELHHYSLDARFVPGPPLDVAGGAAAATPQWLSDAMAEYSALGYGPVSAADIVGVVVYPEGHSLGTVTKSDARCPTGIVHEHSTPLVFRLEADGCVAVECCGRARGNPKDLHILDANNKRTGDSCTRGGVDGKCARLTLKQSKLTDLFLKAETLEALPNGHLPAFTREARQAVRERLGKLAARMFVFTHVCGSGKTRELIIPAVVEHVLKEESKTPQRLFVVLAAPTRKLIRTLMEDVDAALEAAGAQSRCKYYLDGDFDPYATKGIIATCTHSLGKMGRNGKIQRLVTPAARAFSSPHY